MAFYWPAVITNDIHGIETSTDKSNVIVNTNVYGGQLEEVNYFKYLEAALATEY